MHEVVGVRRLTITLFGRLRCRTADAEGSIPTRVAARDLFALLALARHPLQRTWLCFALWPDENDATARANLRRHVAYVERWLRDITAHATPISRSGDLLALDERLIERIDVRAFDEAVASGDLDAAMAWYGGDLLPELDHDWIVEHRVRLRAQYDEILQSLVARERFRDAPATALRYLQSARAIDPYNESWLRAAMRVKYGSGDRAGALHEYETYRAFVGRELGIEPLPETLMLAVSIRHVESVPSPVPTPIESTSFVGRNRECDFVSALIGKDRMLSITGEPGIGKSRIALRCARDVAKRYRDGVVIVDVAGSSPDGIERSLVRALERIVRHSRGASIEDLAAKLEAIVILDGCEREPTCGSDVARRLLQASATIAVVATSRVSLGVPGESVFRLGPLSPTDAETLFLERFRLTRPDLALSRKDEAIVERICRRLDGVPLAIELAAARGRASTLQHIGRDVEIRGGSASIDPLHSAYESSYEQLSILERAVFIRLASFPSGWMSHMALAACADLASLEELHATLGALVDRSLVVPPAATEISARYTMLATTKDFALSQTSALVSSESNARAQALAIARHYIGIDTRLRTERSAELYGDVERDRENVRVALTTLWLGDSGDRDLATGLSLALSRFWADQGPTREGAQWLQKSLEHVADRNAPKRLELLRVIGTLMRDLGDYEASYRHFDELAHVQERLASSPVEVGKTKTLAANAARMTGNFEDALRLIREALAAFRAHGETYLGAWAAYALGTTYLSAARFAEARVELERATHEFNELGATSDSSSSIANLSLCHYYEGDLAVAHELALESIARARATGHRYYFAHAVLNEALILTALGRAAQAWPAVVEAGAIAATLGAIDVTLSTLETACTILAPSNAVDATLLLGVADSTRERMHALRSPLELPSYRSVRDRLRASLGEERFVALRTRGRVVPVMEAIARLATIELSRRRLEPARRLETS